MSIHKNLRGFTLIELLIVIVIVGILTAVAVPQYSSYKNRAVRAAARTELLAAAQFMQRFYSATDRYDQDHSGNDVATQMPPGLMRAPADGTQLYSLSIAATANTYTLSMAPLSSGSMAQDSCGTYTINQAGVHSNIVSGTTLTGAARDACWK